MPSFMSFITRFPMRAALDSLRLTARSLARQPGLVLVVVLTLGLGIGASTALFTYLAAIVWPRFDIRDVERAVWVSTGTVEAPHAGSSYADFQELLRRQGQPAAVGDLAGFSAFAATLTYGATSTFAWGNMTSGGYFAFFGARPALGRLLDPADDRPGAPAALVVSHAFWWRALGGDPDVVGKAVRLNGVPFTLVGVLAPGFNGHGHVSSLYVPLAQADAVTGTARLADPARRWVHAVGRLPAGVALASGQAAATAFARALDAAAPRADGRRRMVLLPVNAFDGDASSDPVFAAARRLLVAAVLLLLLGCANAANLLLARAVALEPEWGLRAALGAGRARLAGRALAESLLLALAGGASGLAFASLLLHRLEAHLLTTPGGFGAWSDGGSLLRLDGRALAFAAGAALLVTLLCGLAPAFLGMGRGLLTAARSRGGQGSVLSLRSRQALVVLQVALSAVLLLNAGLLTRSFGRAAAVDPGFTPEGLLLATVYVPRSVSPDGHGDAVFPRLLEKTQAIPGVEAASLVHGAPLSGSVRSVRVAPEERPEELRETSASFVGEAFFETAGIPLLHGRPLDRRDLRDCPAVVVVSRDLARTLWKEDDAVGRRLFVEDQPDKGEPGPVFEVVGVARETRGTPPPEPPRPMIYFSYRQRSHARMALAVRSALPPERLAPALREAFRATHPDLSIVEMVTGPETLRRSRVTQQMNAEVGALFGLLGMTVATAGLFGLFSYTVSLRAREIGIRLALGARRREVVLRILAQGMALVGLGLALGIGAALGAGRFLSSLLFGVETADLPTFVGAPLLLAAVAFLACYAPARRAARLDPLVVLRDG